MLARRKREKKRAARGPRRRAPVQGIERERDLIDRPKRFRASEAAPIKDSAITGPCHDPIGVTIYRDRRLVVTLPVLRALTSY